MTISLFLFLFAICSTVASLFTEALKKSTQKISSNILALVSAVVIGAGGTIITYIFCDIPFDSQNIVCIILMAFSIWIGSMIGYDKVMQTIEQIKRGTMP